MGTDDKELGASGAASEVGGLPGVGCGGAPGGPPIGAGPAAPGCGAASGKKVCI